MKKPSLAARQKFVPLAPLSVGLFGSMATTRKNPKQWSNLCAAIAEV